MRKQPELDTTHYYGCALPCSESDATWEYFAPRPAKPEDFPVYLGDVKIAASEQVTTYKKTDVPNLWKHKSGIYYNLFEMVHIKAQNSLQLLIKRKKTARFISAAANTAKMARAMTVVTPHFDQNDL